MESKLYSVHVSFINNSNILPKFYVDSSELFARLNGVRILFGRRQGINRCWMLSTPYVLISKPECVEVNCEMIILINYAVVEETVKQTNDRVKKKLLRNTYVLGAACCPRSMLTSLFSLYFSL